ncbi:hypothetical protein V6N13_112092 [Hibiscus sabdariffa]|uniref:Uncharacterized protein n=1 Tax=Hibiscus sabdariffa TaxID=183260 RepID=A0ABR2TMD4_9ROSI
MAREGEENHLKSSNHCNKKVSLSLSFEGDFLFSIYGANLERTSLDSQLLLLFLLLLRKQRLCLLSWRL